MKNELLGPFSSSARSRYDHLKRVVKALEDVPLLASHPELRLRRGHYSRRPLDEAIVMGGYFMG
jgi:hypothetical protein